MRRPHDGESADTGSLRVVQVGVLADPGEREPEEVLEAWFSLGDVASAVAGAGAEAIVVQAGARDAELVRDGVRYHFARTRPRSGLRKRLGLWAAPLSRRLVDRIRECRPDVVHFHSLSFPRHARAVTRALPSVPVLVQEHADRPPRRRWSRELHRWGYAGVAGVAFTSPDKAELYFEAGVLRRDLDVFVVPESSSRFEPGDRKRARSVTGLHGDPCVLSLANLDANKDPLTVLEGVALAAEALPDLHLWCAFRGRSLLARVEARVAADPRLSRRVHLLGRRPRGEVERLLRASDLLVQGSHREGSSYAVIEALACGTTPIVTDIPAFRLLTGGGAVGEHFPPGDARALAEALVACAGRDRTALRVAARRHFEEHLSFDVLGRKLLDAYRALAGTGG